MTGQRRPQTAPPVGAQATSGVHVSPEQSQAVSGLRMWVVPLPWARPPLTQNQRLHYHATARIKQQIHSDVMLMAAHVDLPTGLTKVHVALHWQPKLVRPRDTDNPTPTLTACLNALKQGTTRRRGHGLIADDDSTHVSSECVIHPVAATGKVWLTITEQA